MNMIGGSFAALSNDLRAKTGDDDGGMFVALVV